MRGRSCGHRWTVDSPSYPRKTGITGIAGMRKPRQGNTLWTQHERAGQGMNFLSRNTIHEIYFVYLHVSPAAQSRQFLKVCRIRLVEPEFPVQILYKLGKLCSVKTGGMLVKRSWDVVFGCSAGISMIFKTMKVMLGKNPYMSDFTHTCQTGPTGISMIFKTMKVRVRYQIYIPHTGKACETCITKMSPNLLRYSETSVFPVRPAFPAQESDAFLETARPAKPCGTWSCWLDSGRGGFDHADVSNR